MPEMTTETFTELIKFRLIEMPCCGQLLCWVNPRLPNYCPECGKAVYAKLRFHPEDHIKKQCDGTLKLKGL